MPKAKKPKILRRPKFRRSAMVLPLVAPPGITNPHDMLVPTGRKQATPNDPTPSNLGKRVFWGGGLNEDEKPRQAAAREAKEEGGLLVTFLKIPPLRDRRKREQTTGALTAIRTFHLGRPVGGVLKSGCDEISDNRYDRIGYLLDNLAEMGKLHGEMLQKFDQTGALAKALKILQRPVRSRRKK